jgi:hypothetical protein
MVTGSLDSCSRPRCTSRSCHLQADAARRLPQPINKQGAGPDISRNPDPEAGRNWRRRYPKVLTDLTLVSSQVPFTHDDKLALGFSLTSDD